MVEINYYVVVIAALIPNLLGPIIVCLGLFQKTKASNVIINCVFWLLCFSLMGGALDT